MLFSLAGTARATVTATAITSRVLVWFALRSPHVEATEGAALDVVPGRQGAGGVVDGDLGSLLDGLDDACAGAFEF